MAYQALYRQWRPKDFSHMVGQEAVMETLRHQVETGRIPHAYLFCGSRGTGKTSTAKILARAINCEHPRNGDPCGECDACRQMENDESMDIVEMDAASNRGIDEARNLRESVKYPPQTGRYKVYIIDEVHMLTREAFNALLKTLEEPPSFVVFILATTEPQQLPATILSRCQRFDFGRIPARQIAGRLREAADGAGAEATDGALMAIARAAEGGMRDALSILDMCIGYGTRVDEKLVQNVLGTSDRAFLFRFSQALTAQNAGETLRLIDEAMQTGREPAALARSLCDHLRTMLTAKLCGGEIAEMLDLPDETAQEYIRAGDEIGASRLMDVLDQYMRLDGDLKYAASPRIALENASLKCCLRTEAADTLAINDRIAELENRIEKQKEEIRELEERMARGIVQDGRPRPAGGLIEGAPAEKKAPAREKTKQKTMAPTGRGTDDVWKEALKQLQKTEPSIYGFFHMGIYAGSDGTAYQWRANPGFEFVAQSLNMKERKEKIEAALTEAAGTPATFRAMDQETERQKAEEASDEAYIQGLKDTFGSEPVSVVEELPRT